MTEIGILLQDYATDKDAAAVLTGGLNRLHSLQTGADNDEDPATLYDFLGYQGAPQRKVIPLFEELRLDDTTDDLKLKTVPIAGPPKRPHSKPRKLAEGEEAPPARKYVKTPKLLGGFSHMKRLFSSTAEPNTHFAQRMLRFRAKMDNYLEGDLKNLDLEQGILRYTRENMTEK